MKIFAAAIFMALIFLVCEGCLTTYEADIESVSVGVDSRSFVYQVLPLDETIDAKNDLKFQMLKNILEESLLDAGFDVTDDEAVATAAIYFSIGMDDETRMSSMSGGTTTSYSPFVKFPLGNLTTSISSPRYAKYETLYHRQINIKSFEYDSKTKSTGNIIWEMNVLSTGASNDLQEVLWHITKAMELFYGLTTDGRQKVSIEYDDDYFEVYYGLDRGR